MARGKLNEAVTEVRVIKEESITLELSMNEAISLRTLLWKHVIGNSKGVRGDLDDIEAALKMSGVGVYERAEDAQTVGDWTDMDKYNERTVEED